MPLFHLAYGHHQQELDIPGDYPVDWIEPPYIQPAVNPLQVVRDALTHPVDGRPLTSYLTAKSVVIAVNDKTRPVPNEHLLPPLLEILHAGGVPASAITFLIATGTHLPIQREEFERILPREILQKYRVVSHDCDNDAGLVALGTTSRGTRVRANRQFIESDLRILVGNIEPHHFAGFSGGYKTAAIGLTGRDTITQNHTMLVEPNARIAEFDQNPLRQDIEEIGSLMGTQFALNAILNGEKKIVRVVGGQPHAVILAGIPISQEICQVKAGNKYDLVIASVGGAPKDINFYQSQKALTHASLFTRDGGVIILVAECAEGSGNRSYEEFMEGVTSAQEVFAKFKQAGFRVGPHKAFQVARDAARVKIIMVSSINPAFVSRLLMTPADNLNQAFRLALDYLPPAPAESRTVAILPRATNTIPIF
jgi:nickel-dependent lactate racemase